MKNSPVQIITKITFWLSFILGNICLFGYLISKNGYFAVGGYLFLFIATLINVLVIIGLLIYAFFNRNKMQICLKSISILLINIPIAALYAWIGLEII